MSYSSMLDFCKKIDYQDIIQYLNINNWILERKVPGKFSIFKTHFRDKDEIYEVLVPENRLFEDYPLRVENVINTVSRIENKDKLAIIREINKINMDIVEMRLICDDFEEGTMPISVANNVTSFIQDMIVYSACLEDNPRLIYKKTTKKARSYADIFRFGQTKKGSYIVSIEADINVEEKQMQLNLNDNVDKELEELIPFERRIVSRINHTLQNLNSIDIDNATEFIKDYDNYGININLCESMKKLNELDENIKIEYKFELSPKVGVDDDFNKLITINKETIRKAAYITERFKEIEDNQEVNLDVFINNIRKTNSIDQVSGDITVSFLYEEDHKVHQAKLNVEGENYKMACDALRDGKMLNIKGILDKTTRTWYIDGVSSFKIINNE